MNGSYFQNPTFPSAGNEQMEMNNYTDNIMPLPNYDVTELPMEQSYIENILRLNKGKLAKVYISFPDSVNWKDKIFEGNIEQAGRDHMVLACTDGKWILIPMIYLDYIEFDEKINFNIN